MSHSSTGAAAAPGVAAVLARFDRSSSEKLLTSLAEEIVRLNREQADLAARLKALEQLQTIADRLLPAPGSGAPELPRSVQIEATHLLLDGQGFYPLEFDALGTPYRWTGPSPQFSLAFFVERRWGGKFKLSFSRFAASVSASFMRCQIDGKTAEFTVHDLQGGYELTGVLPPRADDGATLLTFICPATASAAALGLTGDPRQIGLCFQKLAVRGVDPPARAELPATDIKPPAGGGREARIIPHPARRARAPE